MRKYLLVLATLMLPLASVALFQGTASAGKVTGTGNPTCSFGGTINFNPPLSKNGTTAAKKEITTVSASLSSCSGGTPPAPASTVVVKPIKTKTPKGQATGTCSSFESNSSTITVKVAIKWSGEKPTKFAISGLHATVNPSTGEVGFTGNFPVNGSYAGTGHLGVYLTQADSNKIATCSGSISTLHIDRASSSGKL